MTTTNHPQENRPATINKKTLPTPRGLYKRGDIWYSRITGPDGRLIRKRLSADKQTAILMLGEMRKTTELQKMGVLPDTIQEVITDCATLKYKFIERLKLLGRRKSTIDLYLAAWKYIIEDNNLHSVNQITVAKIQSFAERLKTKGTRAQSINAYIRVVRSALSWARDFEFIQRNPLAKWEKLKRDSPVNRRDMASEEITRFFAAEDDEEFRLRWLVYFRTGLRATAGASIRWEWILWDQKALHLPASHNKSRVDFWLPLDDELFEALKRWREAHAAEDAQGPVFTNMSLQMLRKHFRRTCTKAGIDLDGLCLHSIRHTYATACFESSGNNVKVVQELMCHAEGSTTLRYIHASSQQKRETVERNALRFQCRDGEDTEDLKEAK